MSVCVYTMSVCVYTVSVCVYTVSVCVYCVYCECVRVYCECVLAVDDTRTTQGIPTLYPEHIIIKARMNVLFDTLIGLRVVRTYTLAAIGRSMSCDLPTPHRTVTTVTLLSLAQLVSDCN